jgi:hypothetical protein
MIAELYKELQALGKLKDDKPAHIDPIGVFTYSLVNTLLTSGGPVGVKEAWTSSAAQMKSYFTSDAFRAANEKKKAKGEQPLAAHIPTYYDQSRPRVLLKP